jgi:hypothetical protein
VTTEEELELPQADGEEEEKPLPIAEGEGEDAAPVLREDGGDWSDDTEQGGSLVEIQKELDVGEEQKWLEGSEDAEEIAPGDDTSDDAGGASLLGDEDAPGVEGEDFGLAENDSSVSLDAGEEGFEGEDDVPTGALPDLDADEEGELEDDLGFEPASETLPPWDDRGWERVIGPLAVGTITHLWLEAGSIAAVVPDAMIILDPGGAIVSRGPRPESPPEPVKRRVPAIEGATAEVSYATGAVAAIHSETQERTWLVRTGQGGPRIVADVTDDAGDVDAAPVNALVVEPTRGWVWVGGAFGLLAYRPPKRRD